MSAPDHVLPSTGDRTSPAELVNKAFLQPATSSQSLDFFRETDEYFDAPGLVAGFKQQDVLE